MTHEEILGWIFPSRVWTNPQRHIEIDIVYGPGRNLLLFKYANFKPMMIEVVDSKIQQAAEDMICKVIHLAWETFKCTIKYAHPTYDIHPFVVDLKTVCNKYRIHLEEMSMGSLMIRTRNYQQEN